jgi:short-subunit dehydrogenase
MKGTRERGTALITGASVGIGLELARVAAADGHPLVLVARRRENLRRLADELQAAHGTVSVILAEDLTDQEAPARIHAECERRGIEVEVLVNNAGYGGWGRFVDTDLAGELDMVQVNVLALLRLTKLFAPPMVRRGRGRILNLASTAAFQPGPLMAVYYASKAFVLSFSEAVANELAGTGVTVTALCPGPTRSEFQKRADIEGARLVSGWVKMMDAPAVARAGWAGMKRGRRVVVPGAMNRAAIHALRVSPRRLTTAVVRKLQERK